MSAVGFGVEEMQELPKSGPARSMGTPLLQVAASRGLPVPSSVSRSALQRALRVHPNGCSLIQWANTLCECTRVDLAQQGEKVHVPTSRL